MDVKKKSFFQCLLDGFKSFNLFPTIPSYEEQFGTDEELLEEDFRKVFGENDGIPRRQRPR